MTPAATEARVPPLRFPGFSEPWEEKRLGEEFTRLTVRNHSWNKNVLTISAQDGLVPQTEYFNKSVSSENLSNYYLLERNDFAYNKSYSTGYPMGAIKRLNSRENGVVSPLYICFRCNDENAIPFYEQVFESGVINVALGRITQEGARNHGLLNISIGDFFDDVWLKRPANTEQQKIAAFLGAVDQRLAGLRARQSALADYKRGVMQQIFSQQIRFTRDDGTPFPDWQQKRLGDVFRVTRGEVLAMSETKQHPQEDFIFPVYSSQTSANGLAGFYNKYLFENAITWTTDGAHAGETKFRAGPFFCTNVCGVLINNDGWANIFVAEAINSITKKYVSFVGNPKLMNNVMVEIKLSLPHPDEQQKIADFLGALDQRIDATTRQITATEAAKRALFQQMFV